MSKFFMFIMVMQVHLSFAGTLPDYAVSHRAFLVEPININSYNIYEQHGFNLVSKITGCWTSDYIVNPQSQIDVVGNEITVLHRLGFGGSTICASPWPSGYEEFIRMPGLQEEAYHLSLYIVPYADTFPPNAVDLPNYYIDELTFDVLAVVNVDATSLWSLVILMLFIVVFGLPAIMRKIKA